MLDMRSEDRQPGTVAWKLIQPHWDAVSIHDGAAKFLEEFGRLSEPVQHLFAVWWCDSEVCNGGLYQFFYNSTGVLAPEALRGFRATGLGECAAIVETAVGKLARPYPRERKTRQVALQSIKLPGEKRKDWDPFDQLDDRYYAARSREDFHRALDIYASRHAQ